MISELKRKPNETEEQHLWRIGEAKENGLIDLTWDEIADIMNREWREDETEYRTESSYRKKYATAKSFFPVLKEETEKPMDALYLEQRHEIYKIKKQFYDQRREYNKLLAAEARWEHLVNELVGAADKLNQLSPLNRVSPPEWSDDADNSEAVLFLSDWHYGLTADNIWNQYNTEIFVLRLRKLMNQTAKYLKRHKPRRLHVVLLGDLFAGALHCSSRVDSEEYTVEQLMNVSEYIAQLVSELSKYAPETSVHCTYGNHSRTIQDIRNSIHADNMERVIPWWLKQRLKGVPHVTVYDNQNLHEFILLQPCSCNVVAVHGDLENKNSPSIINALFQRRLGINIDMIVQGHIHHITTDEALGVQTMTVGSLCGTDEYANNKRLYATPSQTLLFFAEDEGLECQYNIVLG